MSWRGIFGRIEATDLKGGRGKAEHKADRLDANIRTESIARAHSGGVTP